MSALHKHIADQHSRTVILVGVIEALAILMNEGMGANAQQSLIIVAGELAAELNINLDSISLPDLPDFHPVEVTA